MILMTTKIIQKILITISYCLKNVDCDILYIPQVKDIYEEKIESKKYNLGKLQKI